MDHSFRSDRDITENYLDGPSYRPELSRRTPTGPTYEQLLQEVRAESRDWILEAPDGWQAPSDITARLGLYRHTEPRRPRAPGAPHSSIQPLEAPSTPEPSSPGLSVA